MAFPHVDMSAHLEFCQVSTRSLAPNRHPSSRPCVFDFHSLPWVVLRGFFLDWNSASVWYPVLDTRNCSITQTDNIECFRELASTRVGDGTKPPKLAIHLSRCDLLVAHTRLNVGRCWRSSTRIGLQPFIP
jgi:hypothetical protein